jgi:hypothetical protein
MNTYLWKVTSISTLPSPPAPIDKCAVIVEYKVTATSKGESPVTASINGFSQFSLPVGENLTPYADLTEEQVISWIQSEPNLIENVQANLDGQIDSKINPPIAPELTPLPWA